jgi:aminocarboxymuconate-semialdehyde decarboxylase
MSVDRRTLIGAAAVATAVTGAAEGRAQGARPVAASEPSAKAAPSRAKVIDVHTHMYTRRWRDALKAADDKDTKVLPGTPDEMISYRGNVYAWLYEEMFDWDLRIRNMDAAGVDVALISLTAPNVYWGTPQQSAEAARIVNGDFAAAEKKYGGRIRWFASLPWNQPDDAIAELRRAKADGAIGVCTLTNILGRALIDDLYRPVWREIEAMRMPVFIHPTTPFVDGLGLGKWGLANSIGFTTETTACFAKMIHSGFLDAFPKLNMIACHGGGTLPYLIARMDKLWEKSRGHKDIQRPPSSYLRRLYFDSIVYDQNTLDYLVETVGYDRVLYGSDYPFSIGDMPGILARVDALPPRQRDAIRSGNIPQIFDL